MLTNTDNVNVCGKLILTLNPLNPQMQYELSEYDLKMPVDINITDASGNIHQLQVHNHSLNNTNPDELKLEIAVSMSVNVNPDEYSPLTVANHILNELNMDLGNMLTFNSLGGETHISSISNYEIEWEAAFDQDWMPIE